MATEGLRRSTRVRTAVKSYADEQAEKDSELALNAPLKRKKKTADADESTSGAPPTKRKKKSGDEDEAYSAPDLALDVTTRKRGKKAKSTKAATDDLTEAKPRKKPKKAAADVSWHAAAAETRIARNIQRIEPLAPGEDKERLRPYVEEPSDQYRRFLKSARTQRMFIIDRERGIEAHCPANHEDCPCETIQMAGSTGNVYTVTISHLLSCSCPVGIFQKIGQEQSCKHILYVLHHVLKAPDELKCQNALLTRELQELFANAPALPSEVADDEPKDGNRKPVEDDCPICCMEFEEDDEIVWCRAACGNNVHKHCFGQWAKVKSGNVTCPFCRAEWQSAEASKKVKVGVANIDMPDERGAKGYRNVKHLLEYE
ncbi:hypothetical protein LTR08_007098 [Meristemomyces frigidus]|nr:hypothetical protein LTR08_007098 [Meristemomyces frigidus]